MTEQSTVPEYGARINIEGQASIYLREKALDAVEDQALADFNQALLMLHDANVLPGTDRQSLLELLDEIREALALGEVVAEIALAKTPVEEDE